MLTDILLIALFILIGGVFASAEMALVSLRDSQIKQLATRGKRGGATVARLAQDPNTFLSAVQIGVTVSGGFLSASFGGATIAGALSGQLIAWGGVPTGLADVGSLVLVTVIISYFSIVFSELTAKRLAMQRAESFAMALAPLVNAIAVGLRPVIWFLSASTDLVVRLLGGDPKAARDEVTPGGTARDGDQRRLDLGGRTADRRRRVRCRPAIPARGDGPADRGRLPARRNAAVQGRPRDPGRAALALPGDPRLRRRPRRFRAHPGSAAAGGWPAPRSR